MPNQHHTCACIICPQEFCENEHRALQLHCHDLTAELEHQRQRASGAASELLRERALARQLAAEKERAVGEVRSEDGEIWMGSEVRSWKLMTARAMAQPWTKEICSWDIEPHSNHCLVRPGPFREGARR